MKLTELSRIKKEWASHTLRTSVITFLSDTGMSLESPVFWEGNDLDVRVWKRF